MPGHLDQIGNAGAIILLDDTVEFDERHAELSASMRPSVDLPAPRKPTSAMRRARSAADAGRGARFDQFGDRRQLGRRQTPEQIEDAVERRVAAVAARQEFDHRHVERFGDRP